MEEEINLDRYSLAILQALQRDARLTVQQLADAVGLSATPVWKRVKAMEEAGIIRSYSALVDRERVGLNLAVMVEVNLTQHSEELVRRFEAAVQACPAIVRCASTTGQADYILTVVTADIKRYEQLLHEVLFKLPGVTHVRSSIVLKEIKTGVALPIEPGPAPAEPLRSASRPAAARGSTRPRTRRTPAPAR